MSEDERRLLLAMARWIAKKEQEEIDRLDLNSIFINELRRLTALVAAGPKPEPAR